MKHAYTTSAALALVESQRQITLSITEGVGLDPAHSAAGGRRDPSSMRERAAAVGGWLEIASDAVRCSALYCLRVPQEECQP